MIRQGPHTEGRSEQETCEVVDEVHTSLENVSTIKGRYPSNKAEKTALSCGYA